MITVYIDEITPCLQDTITGDFLDTEVVRLKRKSFLSKFNKKTGWYVNWGKMPSNVEIYALVLKGTVDIQGLIAIQDDQDANSAYIHWACTAPHNNIWEYNAQKYKGVGGHLLAIAAQKSVEWNHNGVFHADAMDKQIVMEETFAQKLREVYTYDWSNEEL